MSIAADSGTRLVLASRSPRRARMLREAGYRFAQADPPFADPPQPTQPAGVTPAHLAADLAAAKARSLASRVEPGLVILAADTICVGADGHLIGQPHNRAEARTMIEHFVAAAHDVVTGVALRVAGQDEATTFSDTATVTFGDLAEAELAAYLDSGQWRGKAGGYNLFDRQAAGWPITVAGDPTTVVGLPMAKLADALARLGIEPGR